MECRTAHPRRQGGVALITAILVVALAATLVTAMISRQQLEIRRSANMIEADQIRLYAQGMAAWAGEILRRDREQGMTDHLREDWATVLPPLPVENGQLAGHVDDLQGRFNLNGLIVAGEHNKLAEERFRRLLEVLGLDPDLTVAVTDWLDADINPGFPSGAEDDRYLGREPAYRAANGYMVSPSELLLINALGLKQYEKLRPHVTVLPTPTDINVNTATLQVLMSLADGIREEDAKQLIEARGSKGYASVREFLAQGALAGRSVSSEGLAVKSSYFMLTADIRIGRLEQRHYVKLRRGDQGRTRVLMQSIGVL